MAKWKDHKKIAKKMDESAAVVKTEDEELFSFTCTLDYTSLTNALWFLKDQWRRVLMGSLSISRIN